MKIGVLGGTSPIGAQLIRLLVEQGVSVTALTRSTPSPNDQSSGDVKWLSLESKTRQSANPELLAKDISVWITVAPIWIVDQHLPTMQKAGAKRIVALSSTSRFTKLSTADPYESDIVRKLIKGETHLERWAMGQDIRWTILRPTIIYGRSTDRNLSEIVRMIRKFKFFPLLGAANGLRQPIYIDDVAFACWQAAQSEKAVDKAYNISGAEVLTYREMVSRIFAGMGRTPSFIRINPGLFKVIISILRTLPRYRHWTFSMADRMSKDMVFDHEQASEDFGFNPRGFTLTAMDLR